MENKADLDKRKEFEDDFIKVLDEVGVFFERLSDAGDDDGMVKLISIMAAPFYQFKKASGVDAMELDYELLNTIFHKTMEASVLAFTLGGTDIPKDLRDIVLNRMGVVADD